MVFPAGGEEAAMPEEVEGMPLLSLPPESAPAQRLHDTRIFIEESEEAQTAALSDQGLTSRLLAAGHEAATTASDGSRALAEPGDGGDVPEDWRTRGLLATVRPDDNDEIFRLRSLVDTRLHEAARAQDLTALRALLDAGASPAALDWAGRTPLHFCVVNRLIEPLKVLLSVPGGANVRDASGWPLLHVALLHDWREGALAVLDAGANVAASCKNSLSELNMLPQIQRYPNVLNIIFERSTLYLPIQIAIVKGDMEMFEAILTAAKRQGVVDCLNEFGKSALCTAITESNLPAIQALLRSGASPDRVSDKQKTALHVAVHDPIILEYLIYNTDITSSFDDDGKHPIHIAAGYNNPESVKLLLHVFHNARVKSEPEGFTPLHIAVRFDRIEVAKVILDKDLGAMNEKDNQGDTPMHVAAKYNRRELAALLLRKGAELTTRDRNGVTVLELISRNFHDASNFFHLVFDGAISKKKNYNLWADVDYKLLTSGIEMSQIGVLEGFVRCGQSRALRHPLIESLMYIKWTHFLPIFYAIICVYAVFLASFNILMVSLFYYKDKSNDTMNSNSNLNASTSSGTEVAGSGGLHGGVYWLLIALTYMSIFMLLLKESCFIYLKRYRYFASVESWVKLAGLVLCAAAPLAAPAPGPWPRHVACAALLLAWLQGMFLVSRFPRWGYYVLMFGKVAVNILKILVTAIFLVIGFSFCFMIQYDSTPPFDGPFAAFVKTLVMMSSEFDYEDLFSEDHYEQLRDTRTIVRVLFVMFVIFVAIVLMNFMIGVSVSDITELNETGNIRRLEKQVELLSTLEALIYHGVLSKWYKNTFGDREYQLKMQSLRESQLIWDVTCQTFTRSRYHDRVEVKQSTIFIQIHSATLRNAIFDTANKNDERVEKQNIDNTFRCKVDALYDAFVNRPGAKDAKNGGREEVKQKESDSITLKKQIESLANDLSKQSQEIKDIKRSIEDVNIKISRLPLEILTSLKEMSTNKGLPNVE